MVLLLLSVPKVMEASGQAILSKLGAKTVGELRPDLIATMSKATPELAKGVEEIAGSLVLRVWCRGQLD